MPKQKKKEFDRLKVLKKISRQEKVAGRSGAHQTQSDRPRVNISTSDYLLEVESESSVGGLISIGYADIVTAFDKRTIGTKVTDSNRFISLLENAIVQHDFKRERIVGQAVIELPNETCLCVSAGVGHRTQDPNDYVIRLYRGRIRLYLKRLHHSSCTNVRAVVYTFDAYLNDPDVALEEVERLPKGCTHVLVAVLGSVGESSPLSPGGFVHNLAGGNNEALIWSADEIRMKANEIEQYHNNWCAIAD